MRKSSGWTASAINLTLTTAGRMGRAMASFGRKTGLDFFGELGTAASGIPLIRR